MQANTDRRGDRRNVRHASCSHDDRSPTVTGWVPVRNRAGLEYEVRFEVGDVQAFDDWFPDAVVEWATLPGVELFRVDRGVDGDRQWLRVTLGFDDYGDWNAFVQLERHRETMARLEDVSESVRTALWAPGAVSFSADGPAVVGLESDVREASQAFDLDAAATPDAVSEP